MSEPNMNPYAVLGVHQSAPAEEIRTAYRKLAQCHHPDKGGDASVMSTVNQAFAILSDPERRSHYDATGSTDKDADNVNEHLAAMMLQVINATGSVDRFDIITQMRVNLKGIVQNIEAQKRQISAARAKYAAAGKRLKAKPGAVNILGGVLDAEVAKCDAALSNLQRQIAHTWRLVDLADTYVYTSDAPSSQMYSTVYGYTNHV